MRLRANNARACNRSTSDRFEVKTKSEVVHKELVYFGALCGAHARIHVARGLVHFACGTRVWLSAYTRYST